MTRNSTGDVVQEYLRDVEILLDRLPSTQRRELLNDLETHIATERAERAATTDAEVLDILERLGAPEVVAAAAYEESPVVAPAAGAPARRFSRASVIAAVFAVVLVLIVLLAVFFRAGIATSTPVVIAPTP